MARTAILLASLLLVASATAYGTFVATQVRVGSSAHDADHVTLYQNGLAAISLAREFEATGASQQVTFRVPTTAVFESVRVEGSNVQVQELRSSLAADPTLHPGDDLIVRLKDGTAPIEGTLVQMMGSQFALSHEGGSILVEMDAVSAIEVKGRALDPDAAGSTTITVVLTAPAGTRTIMIGYLAQGAGWTPHHLVDVQTGVWTFFASLTGLQDWSNVTLDLVAGSPNVVYQPSYRSFDATYSMQFSGASLLDSDGYGGSVGSSTGLGDLHKYTYHGSVSFHRGEAVRLPMASGRVEISRHYYEASHSTYATEWQGMTEKYTIRNTLSEPLPAGTVRMYMGSEWIAADTLTTTGVGETTNITAAHSGDVKTRLVLVSDSAENPYYWGNWGQVHDVTRVYHLEVRNLRQGNDARIDTRVAFNEPGYRLVSAEFDPEPSETTPQKDVWNRMVDGGETLTYTFTITTTESA